MTHAIVTNKNRVWAQHPTACCLKAPTGTWFVYRSLDDIERPHWIGYGDTAKAAWKMAAKRTEMVIEGEPMVDIKKLTSTRI
jgi:hypothetical protein